MAAMAAIAPTRAPAAAAAPAFSCAFRVFDVRKINVIRNTVFYSYSNLLKCCPVIADISLSSIDSDINNFNTKIIGINSY